VEVTVINCHSLNYEIFNANMTLFEAILKNILVCSNSNFF